MNYVYFVAPVAVLFCLGIMNHAIDGTNNIDTWIGFTYHSNFRAFAELNLGILIYFISNKLKQINFTKFGKLCLTLIEIGCLALPFVITTFIKDSFRYDYFMLMIIAIGVCIASSNITFDKDLLNNKVIYYFEKLSLSLYIIHIFALKLVYKTTNNFKLSFSYPTKIVIYLGITFIMAMILLKIIEVLRSKNFYIHKIKRLFITE